MLRNTLPPGRAGLPIESGMFMRRAQPRLAGRFRGHTHRPSHGFSRDRPRRLHRMPLAPSARVSGTARPRLPVPYRPLRWGAGGRCDFGMDGKVRVPRGCAVVGADQVDRNDLGAGPFEVAVRGATYSRLRRRAAGQKGVSSGIGSAPCGGRPVRGRRGTSRPNCSWLYSRSSKNWITRFFRSWGVSESQSSSALRAASRIAWGTLGSLAISSKRSSAVSKRRRRGLCTAKRLARSNLIFAHSGRAGQRAKLSTIGRRGFAFSMTAISVDERLIFAATSWRAACSAPARISFCVSP